MKKTALCLVDSKDKVNAIVDDLHKIGFKDQDISVLRPDTGKKEENKKEEKQSSDSKEGILGAAKESMLSSTTQKGAISGATTGAMVGGALGLLSGLGVMAIPGIGPFLATGPIMALLTTIISGSAVGSGLGAIAGALVGMGMKPEEAQKFEKALQEGRTLIAVESDNDEMIQKALETYQKHDATEIHPSVADFDAERA